MTVFISKRAWPRGPHVPCSPAGRTAAPSGAVAHMSDGMVRGGAAACHQVVSGGGAPEWFNQPWCVRGPRIPAVGNCVEWPSPTHVNSAGVVNDCTVKV
jgi:hypothetical protein